MNKRSNEIKQEKQSIESKLKQIMEKEPNRENFVELVIYLQADQDAKTFFH